MKFKTLTGRIKDVKLISTLIDWDGDSLSEFQETCKAFFQPYWGEDLVCEEFKIPGTRMSLDIINVTKRIAVEVQGRQHSKYVPFLSGSRAGYLNQIKRDLDKVRWCELNDITLIEIHPKDLPLTKAWVEKTFSITL